ncbi:helix-turn-helix transcriptional regulator [Streptomyces kaniharaensis]|uniref:Helix-turn-helix transcriptional regulator n=1 Tax=Streptomyces kaniharaensis TaxID=212423 RepID=A0A6N7KR64_9ACTN|nr:LuxR family transcriptional regulator [Streptomyces kaniharaensis]MQS13059.1 helix-turn-helix transcriptional regulator [Streptomyces kaniharaensis]
MQDVLGLLGLDATVAAVYRAMLTDPGLGVAELSTELGVPESHVHGALDQLADSALLRPSRDTPGTFRVVSPELALEAALHRQEQELLRRQQELVSQRAAAARAVAEYAEHRPFPGSEGSLRLSGLDAIQAQLEVLARELSTECLSVMPGGAQSRASLDASRPLDEDALNRGVSLLTLYQSSVRNDQATFGYARWMTGLGGQVRTAPVLPPRLLVFDRKVAVVPIDPANTRLGALCTREPAIVANLVALFEQAWNTAVPLGADTAADPESGLGPVEKELLKLLAAGLTDETAARRLGVSLRTVRRQMAALMERLDASSRFEAGLKAARLGWL